MIKSNFLEASSNSWKSTKSIVFISIDQIFVVDTNKLQYFLAGVYLCLFQIRATTTRDCLRMSSCAPIVKSIVSNRQVVLPLDYRMQL